MTSDNILSFYKDLSPPEFLPDGVKIMNPYGEQEAWNCTKQFYRKYFDDNNRRRLLLGINPGRFGGGITGIPFTDPVQLDACGIKNTFEKRTELSSTFIYEMIDYLGGPTNFYQSFYVSAVCPLGFVKEGKNLNYYDLEELQNQWEPFFVSTLKEQMKFCYSDEVFSIGMGKNVKYIQYLNDKYKLFSKITPLPHPRWVMQYRLKRKKEFIELFANKLSLYLAKDS